MIPTGSSITAVGIGAVAVVTVASSLSGTPPSAPTETTAETESSGADSVDQFELPTGYMMLVDDTNRLTVAVPDTWPDIDTTPDVANGVETPRIAADADVEVTEAFESPGVLYTAFPYASDEGALYRERLATAPGCPVNEVVPYDDGAFVGRWWRSTGCGPSGAGELHVVVASPASETVTVAVVIRLSEPDDVLVDAVLESFNFTPTATWPAPTVATSSTSTTTTSLPDDGSSSVPEPTDRVVNNTGLIAVDVPQSWNEVDTTGGLNDDASYRPNILAAPRLGEFSDGFDAPGARVTALPPGGDEASILANLPKPTDCTTPGPTSFDNGQLTGLSETWSGCAGGTTDVLLVVASPADRSFTLYARIQDEAGTGAAQLIADSLALDGQSTYPTTTAPASPTPTTGTVPESLWQGPVDEQTVLVIDSARQLRIEVPPAWRDTRLSPSFNDDGSPRPRLVAALHIDTMIAQWDAPGVIFNEFPYIDPATWLANRLQGTGGCTEGGAEAFDNGQYRGVLHTWTDCGGTAARFVTLVVSPLDNSSTLSIEVQVPTADDTALHILLSTFGQL